MKKFGVLILITALGVCGCVTVDNSTLVDADTQGYASGQYRDVRHGKIANFGIFGGGAGSSATTSAGALLSSLTSATSIASSSSGFKNDNSGNGGGMLGLRVWPAPTQGDPMPFARSVAMINYSKKLTRVTYDDSGLVNYEFGEATQRPRPISFGYQPIQ
jgi:hypothetical protein